MQFTAAALLSAATGALALPSGPVATSPVPTLTVSGLTWNTTADNLAVSFNIKSSDGTDGSVYHCEGTAATTDATLVCGANADIKFGFVPDGSHKFQWFQVYWTFAAGKLANDGKTYLANGANSIADSACAATAEGQQCHVDSLSMQGRTTEVTN